MRYTKLLLIVSIVSIIVPFLSGCDPLRLAPTEAQKQNASILTDTTRDIAAKGTPPGSPVAVTAHRAAVNTQTYFGLPRHVPMPPETVLTEAAVDSAKRPDIETVLAAAEGGLSLAAQLVILFGVGGAGFGGKKLLDWIVLARQKSEALRQIVKNNEIFKTKTQPTTWDEFKQAQSNQSPATRKLVAELRS